MCNEINANLLAYFFILTALGGVLGYILRGIVEQIDPTTPDEVGK